jgi:hypothetical protein
MAAPTVTTDLITPVLTPQEVYLSDHTSWNNARPATSFPVLSSTYRFYPNATAWRAWDDEIVAVQTDGTNSCAGQTCVWRFAHHRSDVRSDVNVQKTYFWYQPLAVISQDGRWALFQSNWEKMLGTTTDPPESGDGLYRTDIFLLELKPGP